MYCKSVSTGVVDGITRISQCAFGKPKSKEDLVGVATLGDMILYNDKVINEGGSVHYTHALAELCQCDAVVEFCKSNSCPIELVQLSIGFFTCTFALMRKPMILLNSVGFTSCSLPDFTKAVVLEKIQAALENKAAQKQTESSLTDAILSMTTVWAFFLLDGEAPKIKICDPAPAIIQHLVRTIACSPIPSEQDVNSATQSFGNVRKTLQLYQDVSIAATYDMFMERKVKVALRFISAMEGWDATTNPDTDFLLEIHGADGQQQKLIQDVCVHTPADVVEVQLANQLAKACDTLGSA